MPYQPGRKVLISVEQNDICATTKFLSTQGDRRFALHEEYQNIELMLFFVGVTL